VRLENWKLVRSYGQQWELYDMDTDRPELVDVRAKNRKLSSLLEQEYRNWAARCNILPWDQVRTMLKQFSWA